VLRHEISGVQYLRGFAAMSVVVYHLSLQYNWLDSKSIELKTLQSGVDIFFVISGYIMFYSTDGGTNLPPVEFFKRRLVRILPLYWLVTLTMIVVLLLAPQLVKQSMLRFWHAVASLAFVPMLNPATKTNYSPLVAPGWTLNFEMLFYAIFAIGMAFNSRSPTKMIAIVISPIVILSTIGLALQPNGVLGVYTNPIMLEFAFGMLIAYATSNQKPRQAPLMYLALGILLAALFLLPMPENSLRSFQFGILASFIVTIAVLVKWPRLTLPLLVGDASYSIYLTHFFVLSALAQLWKRFGLAANPIYALSFYLVGIFTTVAVGILCFQLIERPMTTRGKRLLR